MEEIICPLCRGEGEVEYECRDCQGTGYDPTEDNHFGQCHTCYGDQTAVQVCFSCSGAGVIYSDEPDNEDCDDEESDFEGDKSL